MESKKNILVSVVGPTGIGKTEMAIKIAQHFASEIVSADSRQFYRELEIGTAKPDAKELSLAKHHFVNNLSITDDFTVGMFEQQSLILLDELFKQHQVVVMVGGSGLFLKAIWEGLDEIPKVADGIRAALNEEHQSTGLAPLLNELEDKDPDYYHVVDRKNHQRVIRALEVIRSSGKTFSKMRTGKKTKRSFSNIKIGLNIDRQVLFDRIDQRMDLMIEKGLFEEAEGLVVHRSRNALQTVGYSEIFGHIDGEYDKDETVRLLKRNSRRYAKRQITWFKKDEEVKWYKPNEAEEIIRFIQTQLDA